MSEPAEAVAPKKKSAMKGCLLWGGGIFLGLLVIGAIFGPDDGQSGGQQAGPDQAKNDALLPMVEASALIAAFEANEMAAMKDYGNRPLRIMGTVLGIDADITDDPIVRLGGPGDFMGASARLGDEFADYAAQLSKGQEITLACDDVTEVIGIPQLRNCRPSK